MSAEPTVPITAKSTNAPQLENGSSAARTLRMLGSVPVTIAIVAFFALQASWVAVTASFGLYDEQYHLTAIKDFSTRWTPFFIHQSTADGAVGDVTRYDSYLYHYLLSFPYRALEGLGLGAGVTLVALRLFSVLAVSGALVYAWRLFRELGAGPVTANVALAVVAIMPLMVFLAGTLNYDNLLMLLATAFFYYGLKLYKADRFDLGLWLRVLLVGGLASVTQYASMAIAPVVVVGLLVRQVPMLRHGPRPSVRDFFLEPQRGVAKARAALALGALVACALVLERYGLNILRYRTPLPSCLAVHPADICSMYAPAARNSQLALAHPGVGLSVSGAAGYLIHQWIPLMMRYLTLIGTLGSDGVIRTSLGPHVFGAVLTWVVPVVLALVALSIIVLRRVRGAGLLLGATGLYTLVLFAQNYSDYARLGQPVGIQGRYVLVLLPVIVGLACLTLAQLISMFRAPARPGAAVGAVVALVFVMSQGGGITSYLWAGSPPWWRTDSGVRFAVTTRASQMARVLVIPDTLVPDPRR